MPDSPPYLKSIPATRSLSQGVVTAVRHELWQHFDFGDKVVARYRDYGTAAQRTATYEYYTALTDNGYGKLARKVDFDGCWTRYEYDGDGRLARKVSPFGDAAASAPESQCQVTTYGYTRLETDESADAADKPRWRTKITVICGHETARQYRQFFPDHERVITAVEPGAAWDDAGNRVEATWFQEYFDFDCGETVRRETRREHADGTSEEFSYEHASRTEEDPWRQVQLTRRTTVRKFNGTPVMRELEVKNQFGSVESYRRNDLTGGAEVLAEGYDQTIGGDGRPLARMDVDGNTTTYEYWTEQIQDGTTTSAVPFRHVRTTRPDGSALVEAFGLWDERILSQEDGVRIFYHYDAYGNMVSATVTGRNGGTLATSSAYSDDNVLLSETDANGNVTAYTQGACWDARTDALGNVFRNEYFLDGRLKRALVNGAGGADGRLLERGPEGDRLPVYDGNGNVIACKDGTGRVVSTYAYAPFGNVIAHDGLDFPHQFSTKPFDHRTGLCYYGYRFYNPELGRWINRDPIDEAGGVNLQIFGNVRNFVKNE